MMSGWITMWRSLPCATPGPVMTIGTCNDSSYGTNFCTRRWAPRL